MFTPQRKVERRSTQMCPSEMVRVYSSRALFMVSSKQSRGTVLSSKITISVYYLSSLSDYFKMEKTVVLIQHCFSLALLLQSQNCIHIRSSKQQFLHNPGISPHFFPSISNLFHYLAGDGISLETACHTAHSQHQTVPMHCHH